MTVLQMQHIINFFPVILLQATLYEITVNSTDGEEKDVGMALGLLV